LIRLVKPRTVVPVHYEGWKHFRQGRDAIEQEFAQADDVARLVRWVPIGQEVDLSAPALA
jgi:hypothetical protein